MIAQARHGPTGLIRLLTACTILCVTACASNSSIPRAAPELLPLLPPAALGMQHSALQLVRGAFGANEIAIQCVLEINPKHIAVVGLTPLGMRAFSLDFDGENIAASANPMVPKGFDPRRLLADIELAYWPLLKWQDKLQNSTWKVSEPIPGTRRLFRENKLVEEVHYSESDPWVGRLWISNFEFGYSLAIESQPLQEPK